MGFESLNSTRAAGYMVRLMSEKHSGVFYHTISFTERQCILAFGVFSASGINLVKMISRILLVVRSATVR